MTRSMKKLATGTLAVATSLGALVVLSGCGASNGEPLEFVPGSAEMIDHTSQALTLGNFLYASGTYTTCKGQTDGTAWGLAVSNGAGMPTALTVAKGDTTCVLKLTSITTTGAVVYTPTAPITMTTSYQGSPQPFSNAGTLGFYANADLSATTYTSAFTVNIPFSDSPNNTTGAVTATYVTVSGSAMASLVPAPDYTFSVGSTTMALTIDANYVVQSQSGNVVITAGSNAGDFYYIDTTNALGSSPTFAAIDTAYTAASKTAMATTFANTLFNITTSTTVLPVTRNIVIHRVSNLVSAYEVIALTFNHP